MPVSKFYLFLFLIFMSKQFSKTSLSVYIYWICSTVIPVCTFNDVLMCNISFLLFKCLIACILCDLDMYRIVHVFLHVLQCLLLQKLDHIFFFFQWIPWSRSGSNIFLTVTYSQNSIKKPIKVNKDEISCTCGTCLKMHTKFWSVTEGRCYFGDPRIDEGITLIWILDKGDATEWNFFLSERGPATLL
jgi:hypothetical protein